MSEEYSKFKSTKPARRFADKALREALEKGLVGSTKSLIGNYSNEEKIIEGLKRLILFDLEAEEVDQFSTEEGFDYQNFLKYLIINNKISNWLEEDLSEFVYVEEFKKRSKTLLKLFKNELEKIQKQVLDKGNSVLKDTRYPLIAFLCQFAARDVNFRKENVSILTDIAWILKDIEYRLFFDKQKEDVHYKGITIKLVGDDIDVLKSGLKKLMQAINSLGPAFKKQLIKKSNFIWLSDLNASDNFLVLMITKQYLNDPKAKYYVCSGGFDSRNNSIHFFDIKGISTYHITNTLAHELGHGLDYSVPGLLGDSFSRSTDLWKKAKAADDTSVSSYGDKFIGEDFAEFCGHYNERIYDQEGTYRGEYERRKYPHRTALLEAIMDIKMYNPSKPNKLTEQRKIEIMRMFEGSNLNIMEVFTTKKKKKEVNALSPEKKVEFAEQMVEAGLPRQFAMTFLNYFFLKGMDEDNIRSILNLYRNVGDNNKLNVLDIIISSLKDKVNDIIDISKVIEGIQKATPIIDCDVRIFGLINEALASNQSVQSIFYTIYRGFPIISPEYRAQLMEAFMNGFGVKKEVIEKEL